MSRIIAGAQVQIVFCSLLLSGMTLILPMYFKTWFVEPSGNIEIAPVYGLLFGIGLLARKSWARTGAIILGWVVLAISLVSIFMDITRPGFWIVFGMAVFLLYLLHSKRIKEAF